MKRWEMDEVLHYSIGVLVDNLSIKFSQPPVTVLRRILSSYLYKEFLSDYSTDMWLESNEHMEMMLLIEFNQGEEAIKKYIREFYI